MEKGEIEESAIEDMISEGGPVHYEEPSKPTETPPSPTQLIAKKGSERFLGKALGRLNMLTDNVDVVFPLLVSAGLVLATEHALGYQPVETSLSEPNLFSVAADGWVISVSLMSAWGVFRRAWRKLVKPHMES